MARFKKTTQDKLDFLFIRDTEIDENYIKMLLTHNTPEEAIQQLIDGQEEEDREFEKALKEYTNPCEYAYDLDDDDCNNDKTNFMTRLWDNYVKYDDGVYDDDALYDECFEEDLIIDLAS